MCNIFEFSSQLVEESNRQDGRTNNINIPVSGSGGVSCRPGTSPAVNRPGTSPATSSLEAGK